MDAKFGQIMTEIRAATTDGKLDWHRVEGGFEAHIGKMSVMVLRATPNKYLNPEYTALMRVPDNGMYKLADGYAASQLYDAALESQEAAVASSADYLLEYLHTNYSPTAKARY